MAYLWQHLLLGKRKGQQSPKGLLANVDLISDSKVMRFILTAYRYLSSLRAMIPTPISVCCA